MAKRRIWQAGGSHIRLAVANDTSLAPSLRPRQRISSRPTSIGRAGAGDRSGRVLETGAILMWLDETPGRLMPAIGTPQLTHAKQWMIWLSNTLHTTLPMMFYPTHCANGDYSPTHRKAEQRLTAHLDVLAAAQTVDWLESDRPSIHACYLAPMLRWAALYGGGDTWFDLKDWPRLHAFALKFETRDSVHQAIVAEGLGETPFSNPSPCTPPEGSAL